MTKTKPIPTIIDTDIGSDIDDTWALAMALNSPELDIKLIVSATGDTMLRAKIIAKFLEKAGRTDIAIGIGIPLEKIAVYQSPWVDGYDLDAYPGTIYHDGIGAIINTIMNSPDPVTLIGLGPLPNIAAALRREPEIGNRAKFVGMHGSVRVGYGGSDEISPEFNVARYPHSCREVFTAPWEKIITPLDTCGIVQLKGEKYRSIRDCQTPMIQALIDNYDIWGENHPYAKKLKLNSKVESSTLFDTVAIYLAYTDSLVEIENLGIEISDDGFTHIRENAPVVRCATAWRDLESFEEYLINCLMIGC